MTAYKYVLPRFSLMARIERLECVKETKSFVTLIDRFHTEDRRKKNNLIHDTWESAHAELTRLVDRELNIVRLRLQHLQEVAGNVKGLQPPVLDENTTIGGDSND